MTQNGAYPTIYEDRHGDCGSSVHPSGSHPSTTAQNDPSPQHHLNSGNHSSFDGAFTSWRKGRGTPCWARGSRWGNWVAGRCNGFSYAALKSIPQSVTQRQHPCHQGGHPQGRLGSGDAGRKVRRCMPAFPYPAAQLQPHTSRKRQFLQSHQLGCWKGRKWWIPSCPSRLFLHLGGDKWSSLSYV